MLKLEMLQIPADFRWRGKYGHLTYSKHIPHEQLVTHAKIATSVPLLGWSVVHETGEDYLHTHFGFIYEKSIDLKGARAFDIFSGGEVIHPHYQPKLSASAMESLFNEYHVGRKYDVTTGKKVYTAPAAGPWQKLPPMFEWARELVTEVTQAPTLQEAVVLAGVRPRSVQDVVMLRKDAENAPKRFKHLFPRSSFRIPFLPVNWRVLHIHGPSGVGKTKMACALFQNPLVIKPFNAIGCIEMLGFFDSRVHDGIVMDEADLRCFSREMAIALADFDEESVLFVRYTKVTLPAGVKKVFVSNEAAIWPATDAAIGAIARRVTTIHTPNKLY